MKRLLSKLIVSALVFINAFAQQPAQQTQTPQQAPARQGEAAATQATPVPLPPPRVRAEDYRERAGFVTGANFVVDGGMTRKMTYLE